ncbi:MAG: hypothetical protein ABI318_06525 [Chthoniobacteraceae bacterium]
MLGFLALAVAGCGPSRTEREAQARARLDLEEQQRRETEQANKVITGMNQKLGRKPPALDLNLPPAPPAAPSKENPKVP